MHLSAAGALPALRAARADGVDVSVETCPHYLTFAAETIPDGATEFKCCPPIREAANREALWAGARRRRHRLRRHRPLAVHRRPQARETGDFGQAWGGISSVQLGLPAVWTAARARGASLADVVRWMATAPADRVGLPARAGSRSGADADLCVLAPEEGSSVDVARLHHKNPVSAYAGRRSGRRRDVPGCAAYGWTTSPAAGCCGEDELHELRRTARGLPPQTG